MYTVNHYIMKVYYQLTDSQEECFVIRNGGT